MPPSDKWWTTGPLPLRARTVGRRHRLHRPQQRLWAQDVGRLLLPHSQSPSCLSLSMPSPSSPLLATTPIAPRWSSCSRIAGSQVIFCITRVGCWHRAQGDGGIGISATVVSGASAATLPHVEQQHQAPSVHRLGSPQQIATSSSGTSTHSVPHDQLPQQPPCPSAPSSPGRSSKQQSSCRPRPQDLRATLQPGSPHRAPAPNPTGSLATSTPTAGPRPPLSSSTRARTTSTT